MLIWDWKSHCVGPPNNMNGRELPYLKISLGHRLPMALPFTEKNTSCLGFLQSS